MNIATIKKGKYIYCSDYFKFVGGMGAENVSEIIISAEIVKFVFKPLTVGQYGLI